MNNDIQIYNLLDEWIRNKKPLSGNYADYQTVPKCICCSWMDIHSDDDSGVDKDNPFFYIKPLWWDKDAAIIHIVDDKWEMSIPDGEVIKINAYNLHALVPIQLAKKVVELNSIEFDEFKEWDNSVYEGMQSEDIKIIWVWYDVENDKFFRHNQYDYFSNNDDYYSLIKTGISAKND